jgi:hypothetical protein
VRAIVVVVGHVLGEHPTRWRSFNPTTWSSSSRRTLPTPSCAENRSEQTASGIRHGRRSGGIASDDRDRSRTRILAGSRQSAIARRPNRWFGGFSGMERASRGADADLCGPPVIVVQDPAKPLPTNNGAGVVAR